MSSDFLAAIVLAVVGWAITCWLAIRSVKRRKPAWAYRTVPIVGIRSNTPPEFRLLFNEKPVNDAYRTVAIFFNAGNQPIEASDVRKRVTLVFDNAEILREPKLYANDTITEFSTEWSSSGEHSEVKLGFKCLDYNDGAVLEVLHNGKGKVTCEGRIKETKRIAFRGDFTVLEAVKTWRQLTAGFLRTLLVLGAIPSVIIMSGNQWDVAVSITVALLATVLAVELRENIEALTRKRRFPAWSVAAEKSIS